MKLRARHLLPLLRHAVDIAILTAAFWLAFLLRLDGSIPWFFVKLAAINTPYIVAFQFALLVVSDVTRYSWRYVSLREAGRISETMAIAGACMFTVRLIAGLVSPRFGYATWAMVPYGVVVIDVLLAFLGITGIRFVRRALAERAPSPRVPGKMVSTILVGAGDAGAQVAHAIAHRPELGIAAVGFLDDDPTKLGTVVHGLAVLGRIDEVNAIATRSSATHALICTESASGAEIRRVASLCGQAGLATKIIPPLSAIVSGQVNLAAMRELTIEDLLGRQPVVLDDAAIAGVVKNKVVLISGAGGTIGSELSRQVCRFQPAKVVLYERAENSLFEAHRRLVEAFPGVPIEPCVGDVCDTKRAFGVFSRHRPAVVFHAAAHRHVPMMECNPGEAVKNNIFGTKTLADAAHAHGVERFVMISTDKAVNPSSVMGVSKRVAEIYVQSLSEQSSTRFVTVRFGNVLGSVGSVIPIFQEQIAKGGPVTVTHPDMKRYFMTIPEACQLVLQAGSMGEGGEIFILDMGEPVKIIDLARDLIRLSGLRPDVDVAIRYSGVRPGEKLFEELSVAEEGADKTRHAKIFIGRIRPHDPEDVARHIERLRAVAESGDAKAIRAAFSAIVPEYPGPKEPTRTESRPGARPQAAQAVPPIA